MRLIRIAVAASTLAGAMAGCASTSPVPSGAQQVRVVVTPSEVLLDPATVQAGDVYLVLEAPPEGSIVFVQRRHASETPGPLSDEDLARLARGDTEGTEMGGLDAGGCDADQNAAARGRLGYCGSVMKVKLVAGKYAILGDAPESDPATGLAAPMAVLEVLP